MEDRFQKRAVTLAGLFSFDLVNAERRPRDYGRIDVAKIPFVGRDLPVRMLVPFAYDQIELPFGELRIDQGERDAVEGQVPRGVPRVLPFVWHRHDPFVMQMIPIGVAPVLALGRGRGLRGIAFQPLLDDVMIKLLAPKHAGKGLSLDGAMFLTQAGRCELSIKSVRFHGTAQNQVIEIGKRIRIGEGKRLAYAPRHRASQAQPDRNRLTGRNNAPVMGGHFRSDAVWIHQVQLISDNTIVD